MIKQKAKFQIGQIIHHRLFDYIGVVFDIDPSFFGSEEWYEKVARSRPAKDSPWYHVIVHQAVHSTYVAEQNLESIKDTKEIKDVVNPLLNEFFEDFDGAEYRLRRKPN